MRYDTGAMFMGGSHARMLIRCLKCGGALRSGETEWKCAQCGCKYPAVFGIPDLRRTHAVDDLVQVDRLKKIFPHSSFEDLVKERTPYFTTDNPKLLEHYSKYRKDFVERGHRFFEMVKQRVADACWTPGAEIALEIGCGVGACIPALASDYRHVIALDSSLPDLILARKMLNDFDIKNVTLLQAYAQEVPMPDGVVGLVMGQNVLEHVRDIDGVFAEASRLLSPDGCFVCDSANRFNLMRPEPHVKLWLLGYIPRSLQSHYVRWRRKFVGYDKIWPLSYGELMKALRRHFGREGRIMFPGFSGYGYPERFDKVIKAVEKVPFLASAILRIFPVHLVLAMRMH